VVGVARQDSRDRNVPQMLCNNCGAEIYGAWWNAGKGGYECRQCGTVATATGVAAPTTDAGRATPILVWPYRAKSEDEAAMVFQADAPRMAGAGYDPVSQTWAPGQRSNAAIVAALFLSIWLIGLPILIYLIVVKPKGTLTVTYELRRPASTEASAMEVPPEVS